MANKKRKTKRKTKVDERPWVNKDDIVIYDGTKESVDKIHAKAKKLGGYVDSVRYSVQLKRLLEFKLHSEDDPDLFYMVPYRSAVVFTDSAIRCYISEELALSAFRVRTGKSRVSVKIETDDKIVEYVIPQAGSVDISKPYREPWRNSDVSWYEVDGGTLMIDISEMVPNEDGYTHFVIDRVVNPDYEVP